MRIIADVFGSDNGHVELIRGCFDAKNELSVDITLVGDEVKIKGALKELNIPENAFMIAHAPEVITIEEDAKNVIDKKETCSMGKGLLMLKKGEGDAFVTAGSTAACVMGGALIVGRIKGVRRPSIAPIMPGDNGSFMLIDSGANADCRPEMLAQFGVMGSAFMSAHMGIENPTVGLANIGAEENKGNALYVEAHELLKKEKINFVGNAEARYIPTGDFNVVVADGFVGNIILKLTEGVAMMLTKNIKSIFTKNIFTKLTAVVLKGGLADFKKKLDHDEIGGAPLLGLRAPVIKAHGSSNAKAFKNAIRQAKNFKEGGVVEKITAALSKSEG